MHFTYVEASGNLCQGDVLKRTPSLNAVLKEVHPHYLGGDYKHFIVLTQTCDLVRRGGEACSARYITLSSVRSVDVVLSRQLERYQSSDIEKTYNICSAKSRDKFKQFVQSLLNNNSNEYFFLRKEPGIGIQDDYCAFLREAIPLRSRDHYDMLLDARIVSLAPMFQAKLGWLVGHMFSRVATDDWVPQTSTPQMFEELSSEFVDRICAWVDDRKLGGFIKQARKESLGREDIIRRIDEFRMYSRKAEIISRVCTLLEERYPSEITPLKNLKQVLESDSQLKSLLP